MILTTCGSADAAALAALHAEGFERPWSAAAFAELADAVGVRVLAVRDETTLAGFLMVRIVVDEAEVLTLVVAGSRRGAGIGSALVEAAAAAARALGVSALWLEVAADNAAALALYARSGFAPAGRRRDYYPRSAGHVDAIVLRRTLNSVAD